MSGLAARASAERRKSRSNRVASRRALFSESGMGRAGYLDFTGAPDKTPRPFFQGVGPGQGLPAYLVHGRVEGVAPLNQKDLKRYKKMLEDSKTALLDS